LRLAREASRTSLFYLRGKKILLDYTWHYQRARRIFRHGGFTAAPAVKSVREVGVRVISSGGKDGLIELPDNYPELVDRVSESAKRRLDRSQDCSFFPALPEQPLPERTEDIPAVRNGEVIMMRLKDPFAVDGLEELCFPIMQELERKVYGAHVMADKVYVYRSPVSRQTPRGSWLWHFDNHPYEVLKVMIYLSDVGEHSAPFEYLRSPGPGGSVAGSPIAPLYGHSRIPRKAFARHLEKGVVRQKVTGPKGTLILFDNDVIHRGNLAAQASRDVLIFQVRPAAARLRPYVDPRWTGSFQHADFNLDPGDVNPSIRKPRGSVRQAPVEAFD
jgi:hypothetical protein